jgi:competence protein ComEA
MDAAPTRASPIFTAMPTPAERKALLFLAGVIVLGASVRVVRAARDDDRTDPAGRAALARQLAAVDSARGGEAERRRARPSRASGGARRGSRPREPAPASGADSAAVPVIPVDLDVATEAAIEGLPRIGPVLARRIIEDRETNGPFGSMEGFERVRGVGPAMARALQQRVTFSGTARPSNAVAGSGLTSSSRPAASPLRARRH